MIHPFQAEAFHKIAFGDAAEELGLYIDYIQDEDKKLPMERWQNVAASITAGSGADGVEGNMLFITTRNTVLPPPDWKLVDPTCPLVRRFD
jgi:hypothetical protein